MRIGSFLLPAIQLPEGAYGCRDRKAGNEMPYLYGVFDLLRPALSQWFAHIFQIAPVTSGSADAAVTPSTPVAAAVAPLPHLSRDETGESTRAVGKDKPKFCVPRRYVAIPPDLKLSLETRMTPEDKTVLAHAVCACDEADIDDLLVLWAAAQGETDMVIGLANVFRSEGRSEIVEIIERYI